MVIPEGGGCSDERGTPVTPQMQAIIEQNPEIGHVLNDPAVLRQTLDAARYVPGCRASGIQPRVNSLRSSYTGLYPQNDFTRGDVSPERLLCKLVTLGLNKSGRLSVDSFLRYRSIRQAETLNPDL